MAVSRSFTETDSVKHRGLIKVKAHTEKGVQADARSELPHKTWGLGLSFGLERKNSGKGKFWMVLGRVEEG